MPKIVVYIKAEDARSLEAEGRDVAQWVRSIVRLMLEQRKEEK